MSSQLVHLNGETLPLDQAKISVMDRGFLFGDGVYEVIPVYARQLFRAREHLRRLNDSLTAIKLPNPHTTEAWLALIQSIVVAQSSEDQWVYLQVTRGPSFRDHAFPAETHPTIFIMSNPLSMPATALREQGVSAITAEDNRWLRCDIKATSLLANVLLRQLSVEADAAETLVLRDGYLIEGSTSSAFIVTQGVIRTPAPSHLMLPGITYDVVLEICREQGLQHQVGPITEADLRTADEVWITSSNKEVLPVTRLDGQAVGDAQPGPVFKQMYALYQAFKQREMYGRSA